MPNPKRLIATAALLASLCGGVLAVIPDNGPDTTFQFVGLVNGSFTGVAIGPQAVLFVHHVGAPSTIVFGNTGTGTVYRIDPNSGVRIGTTDAIVYRTLDVLPGYYPIVNTSLAYNYDMFDSGNDVGFGNARGVTPSSVKIVGYGGSASLASDGLGYAFPTGGYGTRRAANGHTDSKGPITFNGDKFAMLGSFLLRNGDGVLWNGDSGGAWMVNIAGKWQVAGLNAGVGYDSTDTELRFAANGQLYVMSFATDLYPIAPQIRRAALQRTASPTSWPAPPATGVSASAPPLP